MEDFAEELRGSGRYESGSNKLLAWLLTVVSVLGSAGIIGDIVMYGQVSAQAQAITDLKETVRDLKLEIEALMRASHAEPQR